MKEKQERAERTAVVALAALSLLAITAALIAPFVLAAHYGDGWLTLNWITVPGFLMLCAWNDVRHMREEGTEPKTLQRVTERAKAPRPRQSGILETEFIRGYADAEWEPCGGGFERRVRR